MFYSFDLLEMVRVPEYDSLKKQFSDIKRVE